MLIDLILVRIIKKSIKGSVRTQQLEISSTLEMSQLSLKTQIKTLSSVIRADFQIHFALKISQFHQKQFT